VYASIDSQGAQSFCRFCQSKLFIAVHACAVSAGRTPYDVYASLATPASASASTGATDDRYGSYAVLDKEEPAKPQQQAQQTQQPLPVFEDTPERQARRAEKMMELEFDKASRVSSIGAPADYVCVQWERVAVWADCQSPDLTLAAPRAAEDKSWVEDADVGRQWNDAYQVCRFASGR
jgi:hypothetical protein